MFLPKCVNSDKYSRDTFYVRHIELVLNTADTTVYRVITDKGCPEVKEVRVQSLPADRDRRWLWRMRLTVDDGGPMANSTDGATIEFYDLPVSGNGEWVVQSKHRSVRGEVWVTFVKTPVAGLDDPTV